MSPTERPGIESPAVDAWLASHVEGASPPFAYDLIAAGGSNLTYRVTDASGQAWALRRPPVGRLLATAHDMHREFRIMSALAETDVPVPRCLGYCNDPEITGAPFYVMSFVEGRILRDRSSAADMTSAEADTATDSLIEAQIAFHTVDLDAIGLSDMARHDDYVGRQLTRWQRQVEQDHNRPLPLLTELHDRLVAAKPVETARPGLAHGDYRFDNTVLDEQFKVCAILDWELCTIGNPIADFAWSLEYWAGAGDSLTFLPDPPTAAEIFVDRDEVARRYAQRSGFDLSDLPYYRVFSWWRMSCIVEGSYGRSLRGSHGGGPGGQNPQYIADRVEMQLARAADLAVGVL